MVFKLYITLFLTAISLTTPTDNWKPLTVDEMGKEIKKIEEFYKTTPAYSISVSQASYKSYTAVTTEDKMTGYFIKDAKNNYHSYALGMHTIQNSKIKITVDSLNKSILINEPDKSFTKEVKTSDIGQMLKTCSAVKKITGTDGNRFRFEFGKSNTFSAYEIWTGKSAQIQKIIMYFNAEYPSDPNNEKSPKTKPRAEISFSNYKMNVKPVYSEHFDESKYIVIKNGKYEVTEKWKGYTVYDLRVKNK